MAWCRQGLPALQPPLPLLPPRARGRRRRGRRRHQPPAASGAGLPRKRRLDLIQMLLLTPAARGRRAQGRRRTHARQRGQLRWHSLQQQQQRMQQQHQRQRLPLWTARPRQAEHRAGGRLAPRMGRTAARPAAGSSGPMGSGTRRLGSRGSRRRQRRGSARAGVQQPSPHLPPPLQQPHQQHQLLRRQRVQRRPQHAGQLWSCRRQRAGTPPSTEAQFPRPCQPQPLLQPPSRYR